MRARHGQHFLTNRGAIEAIVARFDPRSTDRVVEIGPGRGALTYPLAERVGSLVAVEIDRDLAASLARRLECALVTTASVMTGAPPSPHVLQADALEVRYADLARLLNAPGGAGIRVIGNLPYAVATALLRRMIEERHRLHDALLMVQKEVADRILASPGTKAYGVISVMTALAAERERVLTLAPGSFSPAPKVRSSVIALRFRPPGPGFQEQDARLLDLLKAAFSERRKKLAGNLAKRYAQDRGAIEAWLAAAGVDLETRAERLGPDTFAHLAQSLPFARPDDHETTTPPRA